MSDFERRMNDRTAEEIYQALYLGSIRDNKDPNESEAEEEFDGYVAPSFNAKKAAAAIDAERTRVAAINKERLEALTELRKSAAHKKLIPFEQLLAESELYHRRHARMASSAAGSSGSNSKRNKEQEEGDDEDVDYSDGYRLNETPSYIKGSLRAYQIEGVNWLLALFNKNISGVLADEMGLGKTFQTIATIAYLKFTAGIPGPHLVVVPKSVLGNWFREFRKWCPALNVYRFHGVNADRRDLIRMHLTAPVRYDVIVTTFDMVLAERNAFTKIKWNYLIVDEAHKLKNNESTAHMVLDALPALHRLLITGTPLQNNLKELWSLLHFLAPDLFTTSSGFETWFNSSEGTEDTAAVSSMHLILNPMMLRRIKSDVNTGIPPKKEIYVSCSMSQLQRSWYLTTLSRDADTINKASGGSASRLNNIVMQLRKVVNHPYLMPGAEDGPPFSTDEKIYKCSGKMVLLDKLLSKLYNDKNPPGGTPHKVLIFCQMTSMLDIMEDYLTHFTPYKYCRIDGNTSNADRDAQMAMFNNPKSEHFLFLLSTRAGGLGINLQAANNVILYDSDWNPQMDLQAQDRAHRIGQKRHVRIFRFITDGTVEERVYKRALKKLYLDAMVVQQGRIKAATAGGSSATREELLSMIRFGAEEIFKSRTQDVTDADIDALLEQGEKQMEDLQNHAKKETQASLASFKLGADESNLYDFEGVNYTADSSKVSSKLIHITLDEQLSQEEITNMCAVYGEVIRTVIHPNLKEALVSFRSQEGATDALKGLKMKAAFATRHNEQIVTSEMIEQCLDAPGAEKLGRGHRRAASFAAKVLEEKPASGTVDQARNIKLPKRPNYPPHQLFNVKRLNAIYEAECECLIRNHRRRVKIQEGEAEPEKLSAGEMEEREALIEEGFTNWTIDEFRAFVQAITADVISVRDYSSISEQVKTKSPGEVKDYVAAFLERGQWCLPNWAHIERRIQRAEKRRQAIETLKKAVQWKVENCEDLENLNILGRPRGGETDRQLFLASYENYLSADVSGAVRNRPENRFDIHIRTRTDEYFARRVTMLQFLVKREYERAMGIQESNPKRTRKEAKLDAHDEHDGEEAKVDDQDQEVSKVAELDEDE